MKKSSVLEDEDNKYPGDLFQSLTHKTKVRYHSIFQWRVRNRHGDFSHSVYIVTWYIVCPHVLFLLPKAVFYTPISLISLALRAKSFIPHSWHHHHLYIRVHVSPSVLSTHYCAWVYAPSRYPLQLTVVWFILLLRFPLLFSFPFQNPIYSSKLNLIRMTLFCEAFL